MTECCHSTKSFLISKHQGIDFSYGPFKISLFYTKVELPAINVCYVASAFIIVLYGKAALSFGDCGSCK